MQELCERNKKESNTLDAADLVRDVANRDYHSLSQSRDEKALSQYAKIESRSITQAVPRHR